MKKLKLTADVDEHEFKITLDGVPYQKLSDDEIMTVLDNLLGIRDSLLIRKFTLKQQENVK